MALHSHQPALHEEAGSPFMLSHERAIDCGDGAAGPPGLLCIGEKV